MSTRHVAIVGGGFSGTVAAIQLAEAGARVTLIERAHRVGRGVAYSTPFAEHLLNVRALGMSAFPDQPNHFADWLSARGEGEPSSFAQRRTYGAYVEELAAASGLTRIAAEAVEVVPKGETEVVRLADDTEVQADAVVLSVGNLAPEVPRGIDPAALGDHYVADPWAADIAAGLIPSDVVFLIGTGLTAIDAALMLDASGFAGRTIAVSRRGLVPRAHSTVHAPPPPLDETLEPRCTSLVRTVRANAERIGWRGAVDQLRPVTQSLWAAADVTERKRFLRHLRPYWDVHRHRIAPQIAERIEAMERSGRLEFHAGKIMGTTRNGVSWRRRGSTESEELQVRRIVNCTGPQGNLARAGEPLLDSLLAAGRIRPDPCRIGIDVDQAGKTLDRAGTASETLFALGPMTRGAFWEVVAVPDIRVQATGLAKRLTAR